MNESEALQKACRIVPMVTVQGVGGVSLVSPNCIASACCLWISDEPAPAAPVRSILDGPATNVVELPRADVKSGRCGLIQQYRREFPNPADPPKGFA